MSTLREFNRWKKVQEKADELLIPIEAHLRQAWVDYCKSTCFAGGQCFPDDVEDIEIYSDENTVVISGTYSSYSCTDYTWCKIPVDFAFGSETQRKQAILAYEESTKQVTQKRKEIKEQREFKEYERLKAKYGN